MGRVRAVPRLCVLYPGICLTTEEKHGKTSARVNNLSQYRKQFLFFQSSIAVLLDLCTSRYWSIFSNWANIALSHIRPHSPFPFKLHSANNYDILPYCLPANIPPGSQICLFLYRFIFRGSFYYLTRQAMYAQHNIEARSWNHFSNVKALSYRYSNCVFLVLRIQHVIRTLHIVICGLPGCTTFFHIISSKERF
jgi:hypothetical protein